MYAKAALFSYHMLSKICYSIHFCSQLFNKQYA